jgi:GntR family transcriptional repressor for pyruvate dehydrogenase complex
MILLNEIKHFEIYELRKILEPEVAALAARRATGADIERLEAALESMSKALRDPELFYAADIEFHQAFAQASGNVAIQTTLEMLYHATSEARKAVMPFIDNWERHWRRHERVLMSIRDRKPELARRAVLEDLAYAQSLLGRHIGSLDLEKGVKGSATSRPSATQRRKRPTGRSSAKLRV